MDDIPDRRLLQRHPRRRRGLAPVAALPRRRAQVPARPHRIRPDAAAATRGTGSRRSRATTAIMVVTGRAHRAAVEAQLPELADHNVVLESEPRDSTAAIGLAAAILERREPGVIIGSFAADHVISGDRASSAPAVRRGRRGGPTPGTSRRSASRPTEPAVGFGYIECGDAARRRRRAERARPSRASSRSPTSTPPKRYLAGGDAPLERRHVHRARRRAARRDRAEQARAARRPHRARRGVGRPRDAAAPRRPRSGRRLEKIAIDYSVAEPAAAAGRLAVIRGHFDWDDVGDFASLAKLNTARPHRRARDPRRERARALRRRRAASS